jgi:sucrose-6-phosphate hydrolase SacC (GH32 family)
MLKGKLNMRNNGFLLMQSAVFLGVLLYAGVVRAADAPYDEVYRPQFHFSPVENWTNDPNGLVFYKGTYHLFFQHNPSDVKWGNMTWGHATSPDLVHWTEHEDAIKPDELGTIFSGSAVVDWNNTSGLRKGDEKVLCAFYTGAGKPFVQCMAYSNDAGKTWAKYEKNPIIKNIAGDNRDPKVFWHGPTKKWVMALYLKDNDFAFMGSKDLLNWAQLSTITVKDSSECPDLFELPVDGDAANTRWVFLGGDGNYLIGRFDGEKYTPESGKFEADYGKNFYATQSYSDIPAKDGRRIQLAWMNGGQYPNMPFNQQMTFPCALTLRTTPAGLRVYRYPVREIESLRKQAHSYKALTIKPGDNPLNSISGDTFDIETEVELKDAAAFGFVIRNEALRYDAAKHELTCLGATAPMEPVSGVIKLRVLVDRSSIEVYGNDGLVSMSSCFTPDPNVKTVSAFTEGGDVTCKNLDVYEMASAWRR